MSLRLWAPLDGDLRQIGVSNAVLTNDGATVDNSGKIGKCYSFANTHIIVDSTDIQNILSSTSQPFSMACWIYLNSDETDRVIIFGNFDANPFVNWELAANCTQRLCAGGTSNYTNRTNGTVVPKTTWTHIAVTYNGATTTFYQNGVSVGSVDGANTLTTKTASSRFYLGSDTRTGATRLKGKMNDFRFYDHALSAAEVHEIAQGLVLHYKLDGFQGGYGNPNLITGYDTSFLSYPNGAVTLFTNQMNSGAQEIVSNIPNAEKCLHLHSNGGSNRQYRTISAISGKSYTISVDYYSTSNQAIALHCELNGGNYSWTAANGQAYNTPGQWTRLSATYTTLTSNATLYYFVYCSNGTDCYVKNFKIEEGVSATNWTPDSTVITVIEDSSGYGHHGSIVGSPTLLSNSARYSASTYLADGTISRIVTPSLSFEPHAVTLNIWFRSTNTAPTGSHHMIVDSNANRQWYEMCVHSTGYFRGGLFVNGARKADNGTSTKCLDGNWHMLTLSYDGTNVNRYVDGIMEKATAAAFSTGLSTPTALTIGRDGPNASYAVKESSLSDFRIYCTALFAADILQLYHTSAKIDNKGNTHAYEFIEHQDNILFPAELSRTKLEFTNGLSRYTQTNCQVTLTEDGYHIYRPPNLTTSANGNTMWGGLKLVNQSTDTIAAYDANRDNWWHLQQNHTYIAAFHARGKSSNATTWGWANNMGWSGGGVNPSPTIIANEGIPANFNGEKDCFYIFKITDAISRPCTSAYSSYVAGTTYLSYRHLTFGWGYASTGTLGTDLYLTNFRLYDITSNMAQFTKQGQANFYDIVEQMDKAQIRKNSELLSSEFIEL